MPPRKGARARPTAGLSDEEAAVLERAAARARQHAEGGKTLLDEIWAELDSVVSLLLADGRPVISSPSPAGQEMLIEYGELRGQAQGLAYAIMVLTQPYGDRDLDVVRAEAVRRAEATPPARRRPTRGS